MINLIPNQEKKKMVMELYYRLAMLSFIMLSCVLFIIICLLLPSYFSSVSKNKIAEQKLELQKATTAPLFNQDSVNLTQDLNRKIELVEKIGSNKFFVSEKVIRAIISNKIPSVKIQHISYKDNPTGGKKISISGTAPSREVLLLFRKTLENNPAFKSVDLPISSFIKGSNIEFSLNLIPV